MESKFQQEEEERTVAALVDDVDFVTSGGDYKRKMQQVINMHAILHETADGKSSR